MRTASLLIKSAGVLFFGCAAWSALRLAAADSIARQGTPEAVAKAIELQWPTPQAELEEALAELDPAQAREALKRALRANPRSSGAWIALGLVEEGTGEYSSAESSLRMATLTDKGYLPAWTLANYYFRRADREQFWVWADQASALAYDDLLPLLRLCDRYESDPARMLAHFKHQKNLYLAYLNFLIGEDRLDSAQIVARKMSGDRANDRYLIALADRQLREGKASFASELWNAASGFAPIGPSEGGVLTNGDLGLAPSNIGFDWRFGEAEGIFHQWRPSELSFTFSGSQPEVCVLLEQDIWLAPRHLQLRFEYLTDGQLISGIRWSLENFEGPPIGPSSQWREGAFDLPRSHGLRNLKLFYRREPGTTRAEGRLKVRNLRLETAS